MSDLNRLRELGALLLPKIAPVTEAKVSMDGLSAIVNDALMDLEEKLGKGGALETMLDKAGVSSMAKDTLSDLDKLFKKFKSDLDKLMLEAEGMMSTMSEGMDDKEEGVEAYGSKGMKSTPWTKKFKSQEAFEKWMDKHGDDITLGGVRKLEESHEHVGLVEMAALSKMNSGWIKSRDAKELVKAFRAGEETVELKNGDSFKKAGKANAAKLTKGDALFGSYNSSNQGADLFTVVGCTDWDKKYGDGGVKFDSVEAVLKAKGATSLKGLDELQDDREYGQYVYLVVKDMEDGDEWRLYLNDKGQWCRGSGEEPVSFVKIEKV